MTKTFCDRCGKEIEQEYAWLSRKVYYTTARLCTTKLRENWESDDKYICPECEESYIHWFLNPKLSKENK